MQSWPTTASTVASERAYGRIGVMSPNPVDVSEMRLTQVVLCAMASALAGAPPIANAREPAVSAPAMISV